MKMLKIIGSFLLTSCGGYPVEHAAKFRHILPDTSKSWAGRMTREEFYLTRNLERKLNLRSLTQGVTNTEVRIWNLSGSYDPQVINVLYRLNNEEWGLRTILFNRSKDDSIYTESRRRINSDRMDTFNFNQYWNLPSQSDLSAGDSYGCIDGGNVFMEIADSTRYRFMWYRCPAINKDKDSVFLLVNELPNKLHELFGENEKPPGSVQQ